MNTFHHICISYAFRTFFTQAQRVSCAIALLKQLRTSTERCERLAAGGQHVYQPEPVCHTSLSVQTHTHNPTLVPICTGFRAIDWPHVGFCRTLWYAAHTHTHSIPRRLINCSPTSNDYMFPIATHAGEYERCNAARIITMRSGYARSRVFVCVRRPRPCTSLAEYARLEAIWMHSFGRYTCGIILRRKRKFFSLQTYARAHV